MLRNQEHASQTWCPFARTTTSENAVVNRQHEGGADPGAMCLGAGCMAWRWSDKFIDDQPAGYCGLAGLYTPSPTKRKPK